MAATAGGPNRRDIFASVFPPSNFTTPTPENTPSIGVLASPGRPFGGFHAPPPVVDETVRLSRAWSTATRFLSLPSEQPGQEQIGRDVQDAMHLICKDSRTRKDLLAWYANETGTWFRRNMLNKLSPWHEPVPRSEAKALLLQTVELLEDAQGHCIMWLLALRDDTMDEDRSKLFEAFQQNVTERLHFQYLQSLPLSRVQDTMAAVFLQEMKASLVTNSNPQTCLNLNECYCNVNMDDLPLEQFYVVGLGGALAERAFAQAMHIFLNTTAINRRCFQVDWARRGSAMQMLHNWVQTHLRPFVRDSLRYLTGNQLLVISESEHKLAETAVTNLGRQRTDSIFDYIKTWPDSTGALLDIKHYLTLSTNTQSQSKAHVCDSFIKQAATRLLHAGASTVEILSIYANVIHAFRLLDARGVMLEKVAHPIRYYLRHRDDTVAIIAASFLADVGPDRAVPDADAEKICVDIIDEVASSQLTGREHRMLRYDDMAWMPDPIDAGPDYKASKSEDVLAYILGLFDAEDFIKEVTSVLAQHLLQATDPEYTKEIRLVELFKSRLDATKLQAAEVMLKDVHDSINLNRRMNLAERQANAVPPTPRDVQAAVPEEGITLQALWSKFEGVMNPAQFHATLKLVATKRQDLYFAKRTRLPPEPVTPSAPVRLRKDGMDFRVQVLSSFFWPQMRANDFELPKGFAEREQAFQDRFSQLGNQRKLHFRHALAHVDVKLELEDRFVFERDVPVWRASVVEAFGGQVGPADEKVYLTAGNLEDALDMEEELVLDALAFWMGRRVLFQPEPGQYAVLERLDMDTGTMSQQAAQVEEISAVKTQDAMLRESAPMFETFIANMLRNGGPKAIEGMMGITGMLKMVLPLFTYGEEETKWLLEEMEERGEVVRNGALWAVSG
ncbi:hypothetical protein LTR97_006050 [Elasticomyces elasticus]|uniref:Cullin family profile domain-containing protein n=1 Tax=Elasticomyces elasticus TaxID=574655 RepID=A0AAN7W7L4_9PEZI|nr:hypothetical protein LTR97_006050 [Elasticomyces elasticus]